VQRTGVRTSTLSRGHQHGLYRKRLTLRNLKVGEFHRDNNVRGHAHGRWLVDRMRTRKAGPMSHDHKHIWEHIKWASDDCPMSQKVLAGNASMAATIKATGTGMMASRFANQARNGVRTLLVHCRRIMRITY
jgi:hypothetical protein